MDSALGQRDDGTSFFFHAAEGNRRVLIQAQQGLVFQGKGGSTSIVHPNGVAGAKGVIEFDALPLGFPRPLNLDIPFYRNRFGSPWLTGFGKSRPRVQQGQTYNETELV
jgi:hypothetical protein